MTEAPTHGEGARPDEQMDPTTLALVVAALGGGPEISATEAHVAETPERSAVVQRARELVDFARRHGYRLDELIEIIEDAG